MSKTKVGIITLYQDTNNYGGALQAYALTKYINSLGVDCKQISYKHSTLALLDEAEKKNRIRKLLNPAEVIGYVSRRIKSRMFNHITKNRKVKFSKFLSESIPHTEKVYSISNIKETCNMFDIFITGSDQVWNMDWYDPAFFLEFVPPSLIKASYGASLGKASLSEEQKTIINDHLKDFENISLREKENCKIIDSIIGKHSTCVVDPTLLLDVNQWDEVLPADRPDRGYIFCYFLGDNKKARNLACEYARKMNKKLVSIAYPDSLTTSDIFMKGEKITSASPQEFINLIKYADAIFTDSFHCCVFSCLYRKDFFAFDRIGKKGMGSRITNLMDLFGVNGRFFETELTDVKMLTEQNQIHFDDKKFQIVKRESMAFLHSLLEEK